MKIDLKDKNKEKEVIELVQKLIKGEIEYVSISNCPPSLAIDLAEKGGLSVDEDSMSTNGWQFDYWFNASDSNNNRYTLSGTGYYGDVYIGESED